MQQDKLAIEKVKKKRKWGKSDQKSSLIRCKESCVCQNVTRQTSGLKQCPVCGDARLMCVSYDPKRGEILNLYHWMVAWNLFMEATLHYHPQMYYELFKYQQHMCEFAAKFKLEACYMYDIDCRLATSAQLSVDPAERWGWEKPSVWN